MTGQSWSCSPHSSLSAQYPIWQCKLHATRLNLVMCTIPNMMVQTSCCLPQTSLSAQSVYIYIKISNNWMVNRSDFLPIIICWCIACLFVAEESCFYWKCVHVLYCLIKRNFLFNPLHLSILLGDLFLFAEQATIPSLLNPRPFQLYPWITCSSFLNRRPFHCSSLFI